MLETSDDARGTGASEQSDFVLVPVIILELTNGC